MERKDNSMNVKVSIVVPVYNVALYIDRCLESLVNQTYRNIEIIVINDGSTDCSGEICQKWAENNPLVYISKSNEGAGAARNLGINVAKGNYILFVDSDDWMEPNAVEEMVKYIKKNDKPDFIALSKYYEFNDNTKELKEIQQNKIIGLDSIYGEKQRRLYLLYGFVVVWGKLFRREFLLHNKILMPPIPHEDNAVFPEIIFSAENIRFCNKPLYYYRINRKGNVQSNIIHYQYMSDACDNFLNYLIKHEMLIEHYAAIKYYVESRLKWSYDSYCQKESDVERRNEMFYRFKKFRDKYFENQKAYWEYRFGLLGSFGSRWVIHFLGKNTQQLIYHMPFSSVIAQMTNEKDDKYKIYNKNEFRCKKIKDDVEGELSHILEDNLKPVDFFFIDFLEERYDVAELNNGNYITLSEAFNESDTEGLHIKRVVKAGTEHHFKIWQNYCRRLAELLKEKYSCNQVVLIKSRLATCYQKEGKFIKYPDQRALEFKNLMIERMENYFLDLMDNKIQIYTYPKKIFTEESFRMGADPQYLGDSFYTEMEMQISACFDCVVQ